jgi:acetyltransferase
VTAARREARGRLLGPFFAPDVIAVIGASSKPGSVGRALLENLRDFEGRVFPVNPHHDAVLHRPAFASVAEVPAKVDLALIATPARVVPEVVRECALAGVKAAIIHSAGFKECGPEGAELEKRILDVARQGGMRLIGPNCLGLMAPHHGLNATFARGLARPGSVAFISQSGALCSAVLDWSVRDNVGFSALVSVGSMLDVGWGDIITSLGDDPHTRSIIIYMESIGDASSFLSAAREVAFTKPIVIAKAGRSEAAAKAAASHTGALTGSDAVIDAAFRRAGVLRVDAIEDLFDLAEILGKQPAPRGPRLGIVTNAGGPAALAVDRLVAGRGELALLSPQTVSRLDGVLPAHWSHANPVDVLGDADETRYARAMEAVIDDPATDGLLVILTPQAMSDARATAAEVTSLLGKQHGKPILASWMGGPAVEAGEAVLNAAGIPTFKYPDRAVQAFNYMAQYRSNLDALYEAPTLQDPVRTRTVARAHAGQLMSAARRRGRVLLTQHESKQILAAYDIPVVTATPATTADQAAAVATRMGFPVAVKLHSETLTHKREVGGVYLNIGDAAAVRQAWSNIERAVMDRAGPGHFLGVTVERMVQAEGCELILGSSIDPQFGPVILFGAGGRWVEVLPDRALGLPPLTSTLARRLMEQTRVHAALKARRGDEAVDLDALEQTLVRFSQLVAEHPWIKEIDVNPLFASSQQIVALDARIILHDPGVPEPDLPKLAIRPYPQHYATAVKLPDGTPLLLRAIRPEDESLMVRFHETLSDQSVYYRYFTAVSLQQRTRHSRLARLCFIDYNREIALVAVHDTSPAGRPAIRGGARLCRQHGGNTAEFAIVISDPWQGRGLGTLLLRRLVEIAREEGVREIRGMVMAENIGMRRLCERIGFTLHHRSGEPELEATLTP